MSIFDFFKKKTITYQEDNDTFDLRVLKEEFFALMKPYYDAEIIREIYVCDHFCLYAFGEEVYIACPYTTLDGHPYGIYMTPSVMRKIVKTHRKFYPIASLVLENIDQHQDLFFFLPKTDVSWWKNWIKENKNVNKIDKNFEKEISNR